MPNVDEVGIGNFPLVLALLKGVTKRIDRGEKKTPETIQN